VASGEALAQSVRSRRAWQLAALVGFGAGILVFRLFQMQVVSQEDYSRQAQRNRVREERITAPRGVILDRDDRVLADSRPSFTVLAVPYDLLRDPDAIALLADLLEVPRDGIEEKLRAGARHLPRVIRRDVSFAAVSRVAEREDDLPGISVEVANVRTYPYRTLAAHVLGQVGEVSESEVQAQRNRGKTLDEYRSGDFLGRMGLERVYEEQLKGRPGLRALEVDSWGRVVGALPGEGLAPTPGRTLHLYLDARLQAVAESLLVGRRGAVVLLDPSTGGVRVMASSPTFDPNLFSTGINATDWSRLNTDPNRPLLNRTVQAQYAPGSTFKMIPFALALENRLVGFEREMDVPCFGGYQFGNRWFRCWEDLGHGKLALQGALIRSCDVYFYQLAERSNVDDLAAMAHAAGLGQPTGIDLPQESLGNVPTTAWLDTRYGKGKWTRGTMLNLIIGQGEYLVTPIQMACYSATLANRGEHVVPRLVRSIEDEEGQESPVAVPSPGRWDISARTLDRIREAMRLVVADDEGTGRVCRVEGFMPAAKTGTAENPHGPAHSWFVGWAPVEDPEVAFAVVVEAGGHGSDVAAPIVRRLLRECLAMSAPPPDGDAS